MHIARARSARRKNHVDVDCDLRNVGVVRSSCNLPNVICQSFHVTPSKFLSCYKYMLFHLVSYTVSNALKLYRRIMGITYKKPKPTQPIGR